MEQKVEQIVQALWKLKYRNTCVYDIADSGVSKYLIISTAINVSDNKKLSPLFAEEIGYTEKIEGWNKGEWIIFDLDEVVVHLFASGFREKYNIDKLYKNKEILDERKQNNKKKKNKV